MATVTVTTYKVLTPEEAEARERRLIALIERVEREIIQRGGKRKEL